MKKTLNDIFDEAKADEIENLVNKNDAPKLSDDTLSSIKKRVYAKTDIPETKKKKPFVYRWQSYVAAAACLCLILGGILVISRVMKLFIGGQVPGNINGTEFELNENNPPEDDQGQSDNNNDNADNNDNGDNGDNNDNNDNNDSNSNNNNNNNNTNDNTNNSNNNNNNNNSTTIEQIDNGVLKDVSPETMNVPENMKFLGTVNATEENNAATMNATVVIYSLDGDVVNWKTENDLVYVITKGNNRLVVIDSENLTPIYNVPLAGVPAEMNFVDDKIYISLPDLCRIDVFSKSDCVKVSSIYFDHEVTSFCLDGDYIYYSEKDQHCKVFKKNLSTGELKTVQAGNQYFFYAPKVYLNKEDQILYIGESGSTGSAIYYFDAVTLELKSVFKKNDYGIMNHTREIFHYGDEIFWGSYRLSDTNAREVIGKYGTANYGSVTFVSDEMVSTYEGLFLTDTYECVIDYFDAGFDFEYMLVSESYNIFFRQRIFDKNIIIGVNFELQEIL